MNKMNSSNETKVLEYIKTNGEMTTGEGIRLLGVSESTIRRIFIKLQKEGEADRIFGGIKAVSEEGRYRYKEIAVQNVAEKKEIGTAASRLVRDGEFLYLDSGTTTLEMSRALSKRLKKQEVNNLTVITNSVKNVDILAPFCGREIFQRQDGCIWKFKRIIFSPVSSGQKFSWDGRIYIFGRIYIDER